LQEYGHRFGKLIHLKLLSGQLLLVHLKVVERATCSKVLFQQGWQDVIYVVGLERGDHIYHHLPQGTFEISKVCLSWNQRNQEGKQGLGPKTQTTICKSKEENSTVSSL
jgi:hypothetical protein